MDKGIYFQLIEIGTDYEKVKSGNWWRPNERTKLTEQCLLWQRLMMYASLEDEGKNCGRVAFEDVEEISKKHEIPCYQIAIALKEKLVCEGGHPLSENAKAPASVQKAVEEPARDTEKTPRRTVRKKTKMIMDANGQFVEVEEEEEIAPEEVQTQNSQEPVFAEEPSAESRSFAFAEAEPSQGSSAPSEDQAAEQIFGVFAEEKALPEQESAAQISVKKVKDPEYEKTIEMMTLALGQIQKYLNKWNGKQTACFAVKKLHNYAKMMHGKDMFANEEKNS